MEIITLDFIDLFWAWGIILITIILSWWQKLDLEGEILIASGRSLIQLMFIGYILEFIFAVDNPFVVILVLLAMVTIAAVVARNRISKKIKGLLLVVWSGLFFSTSLIISYGIVFIIQPENWYNPQYLIPLVGMILGNTLNGA